MRPREPIGHLRVQPIESQQMSPNVSRPRVSVLVTDLDNTLFDWVHQWHCAFTAKLEVVCRGTGIPEPQLLEEFRAVHVKYGTSEYAYAVGELPSVQRLGSRARDLVREAETAVRAAVSGLGPYSGVCDTLAAVKRNGTCVVGYTESMPLYTIARVSRLGLDGLLDYLYMPPNHGAPEAHSTGFDGGRSHSLRSTIARLTPPGELKPSPRLLLDIVAQVGGRPETAAYVGDSQTKDIAMAQPAGVIDVWARYGAAQNRPEYELLRAVTHWTAQAVEQERTFGPLVPGYVLHNSFGELLDVLNFLPHSS